jgi:hypothetical protein
VRDRPWRTSRVSRVVEVLVEPIIAGHHPAAMRRERAQRWDLDALGVRCGKRGERRDAVDPRAEPEEAQFMPSSR